MLNAHNHSPFVIRHLEELQDLFLHPVQVKPIAGQANYLVDVLSRHKFLTQRKCQFSPQEKGRPTYVASFMNPNTNNNTHMTKELAQLEHEECYKVLKQKLLHAPQQEDQQFQIIEAVIKKKHKGQIVQIVPKNRGPELLNLFHDQVGHYRADETKDNILKHYYWRYVEEDIKRYCPTCDSFQRFAQKSPTTVAVVILASRPFEVVGLDFIGPMQPSEGYKYLLVALYYFTRWPMIKKDKNC